MNSGKIVADGTGRVDGTETSKVLQEVLADLKREPVIISGDWSSDIVASGLASGFWLHQDDNQKDDNQHDDNQKDDNQLDDNQ